MRLGLFARVVHEDTPHIPAEHGVEVSLVLPADRLSVGQLDEYLINQGRGLKGVPGSFAAEMDRRNSAQFPMGERQECFSSGRVTITPACQQIVQGFIHDRVPSVISAKFGSPYTTLPTLHSATGL